MKLLGSPPKATLKLLTSLLIFIAFAIALFMVLLLTESLFTVWALLAEQSGWFIALYAGGLFLLSGFFVRLILIVLRPKKRPKVSSKPQLPPSQEQLHAELQQAAEQGIEVVEAQKELAELQQRQTAKEIHVVLFGSVSMGKSALINALLPGAEVETDPRSGTTQTIQHYHWTSEQQQALILTDMPGLFEPDGQCSPLSQDEAKRAHLVLYLCDGDLTRDQYHELETLIEWQKPLALVLNKIDRYSQEELDQIQTRLRSHLKTEHHIPVIPVQSGGQQEVIRVLPNGEEERVTRTRPPQVKALTHYLESTREQLCQLHQSRDNGFLLLGKQKLENALSDHRLQESKTIVKSHTRKAIIGAMAAVTPGTDLLIQGYLGIQLVQNLGKLYDIPIQEIDIRRFINIASKHVGKTLPMMLAIAGNVFKSFPGIGTLTGSLLHAVAYGMIFESLGKSVAQTLHTFGKLEPQHAIHLFEENLREDLEHHARKHAQMVFEELKKQRKNLIRRR
ncbi:MAG: GTPase [Gammaproteobacteria bacterium]|nr:GTPase [Gammaproteobacteria bacterium]